ncbi:MAG: cation:proton antiporter [Candidatus Diapherotrites archaeon]
MALEALPLTTIGVIVVFALVLSTVLKRLGLNPVLGYIVSGFLLGPFVLGFLQPSDALVQAFGEMGLFVLLFYLGLELSFKEFTKGGPTVIGMALLDTGGLVLAGVVISLLLGFSPLFAIVIGLMLASSSSAIAGKFILDKGLEKTYGARISLAILVLQDFMGILLLVFVTSFSSSGSAWDLSMTALVFAVASFFAVRTLSTKVERWMKKQGLGSVEITLYALGVGLIVATLGSVLGLSTALGAYFAGFALSETRSGEKIKHKVGFLRDFFFLFFFVGFGTTLFYSKELAQILVPSMATLSIVIGFVLLLVAALITAHLLVFRFFGPLFGLKNEESSLAGILLTPLGEFVVIIATAAAVALPPSEGAILAPIAFVLILLTLILFQPLFNFRQRYGAFVDRLPTFKGVHMPRSTMFDNTPHVFSHVKQMAYNAFIILCLAAISILLERALPTFNVQIPYARTIVGAVIFLLFAAWPLYNIFKHARYFYNEVWKMNRAYWKKTPHPKKWAIKKARS